MRRPPSVARLADLLLEAAPREMLIRRLGESLAQTSRQVNTLERRLAPALRSAVTDMRRTLDEREREERLRLKLAALEILTHHVGSCRSLRWRGALGRVAHPPARAACRHGTRRRRSHRHRDFSHARVGAAYVAQFDGVFARVARKHGALFYPFFLEGVALDRSLLQPDLDHPNERGVIAIVTRITPVATELVAQARARRTR